MTKMTSDYLKKINKRVRDRNYRFQKLSDAEKRVRIAKDVIGNLEAGKLVAAHEGYLTLPGQLRNLFAEVQKKADYEYHLEYASPVSRPTIEKEIEKADRAGETPLHAVFDKADWCTVCAIGGVFVSAVLRSDGLKVSDMTEGQGDSNKMREYLGEYFTRKQLGMIEAAFEVASHFAELQGVASAGQRSRAVRFGQRYGRPEDRLIAIMENIIENEGSFRP